MKLPSGRIISSDGLLAAATIIGSHSYELENIDEAADALLEDLTSDFFTLNGTEQKFELGDAVALIDAAKSFAEELGGALQDAEDAWTKTAKEKIAEKYPDEEDDNEKTGNHQHEA
jgi:hypothetical protein